MTSLPRVDVIIPVFNLGEYLAGAVASALDQRGVGTRVIVIDDGSDVPVAADDFGWPPDRVTLLRNEERRGIAASTNRGLELLEAPFVGFLDADDLWPVDRCRVLHDRLVAAAADIAYGIQVVFNDGDEPILEAQPPSPVGDPTLIGGATLIDAGAITRVGRFDESLRVGSYLSWLVAGRHLDPPLREIPVNAVTLLRRSHARNTTRTRTHEFTDYLQAVVAHRRAVGGRSID